MQIEFRSSTLGGGGASSKTNELALGAMGQRARAAHRAHCARFVTKERGQEDEPDAGPAAHCYCCCCRCCLDRSQRATMGEMSRRRLKLDSERLELESNVAGGGRAATIAHTLTGFRFGHGNRRRPAVNEASQEVCCCVAVPARGPLESVRMRRLGQMEKWRRRRFLKDTKLNTSAAINRRSSSVADCGGPSAATPTAAGRPAGGSYRSLISRPAFGVRARAQDDDDVPSFNCVIHVNCCCRPFVCLGNFPDGRPQEGARFGASWPAPSLLFHDSCAP
jgi:hypothetical protein